MSFSTCLKMLMTTATALVMRTKVGTNYVLELPNRASFQDYCRFSWARSANDLRLSGNARVPDRAEHRTPIRSASCFSRKIHCLLLTSAQDDLPL